MSRFTTLRNFNHILTIIVVLLAVYIMVNPFISNFSWWVRYEAPVISRAPSLPASVSGSNILKDNTVIIPNLGLAERIYAGPTASELNKGVWLRPNTSNPANESNTVLAGHRFTYSGQDVFYHLDKVSINDSIEIHWEGVRYEYVVKEIKVVPPTAIEVEAPTDSARLTLYTCTPLWSAKDRLVIVAEFTGESI